MKQFTVIETITPELARIYLERNEGNRNISPLRVTQYARQMSSGAWQLNGESIKFFEDGSLGDGQHRLLACVEANVPFVTNVTTGISFGAKHTIDQCKSRTTNDVLTLQGEKNCADLARLLTLVWRFDNQALGTARFPTPPERKVTLDNNPHLRENLAFVVALPDIRNVISRGIAAFLHYLGSQIDKQKTEVFLEALAVGADLPKGNPILELRNTAISRRNNGKRHGTGADEMVAVGIKALRAYLEDRSISMLRFNSKEQFPTMSVPNKSKAVAA